MTNLPRYFPAITLATPVEGGDAVETTAVIDPPDQPEQEVHGQAWFRAEDSAKRLEWGSKGENDYHGSLTVTPNGNGSTLTLELHSETAHEGVDASIDETLEQIDSLL